MQPPPPGPDEEGNMYDELYEELYDEPEEYIADMYDTLNDDQQGEGDVSGGTEPNEEVEEEVLGASAVAARSHNKDSESSTG